MFIFYPVVFIPPNFLRTLYFYFFPLGPYKWYLIWHKMIQISFGLPYQYTPVFCREQVPVRPRSPPHRGLCRVPIGPGMLHVPSAAGRPPLPRGGSQAPPRLSWYKNRLIRNSLELLPQPWQSNLHRLSGALFYDSLWLFL